jgi:hypothetical protein
MRFLPTYNEILPPLSRIIQHMKSINVWNKNITKNIVSTTGKYRNILPAVLNLTNFTTICAGKKKQLLIHKLFTCTNILWTYLKQNCTGLLLSRHNLLAKTGHGSHSTQLSDNFYAVSSSLILVWALWARIPESLPAKVVNCVVLCIVCVWMCTVLLPPCVNPTADNKYIDTHYQYKLYGFFKVLLFTYVHVCMYVYIYIHTHTHTYIHTYTNRKRPT